MLVSSLFLLAACVSPTGTESLQCASGACEGAVVEPLRYPMGLQASAFDVRGADLLVPEVDGVAIHDLSLPGTPRRIAWQHSDPLLPVEARFGRDDEVVLRTTDAVWWLTGADAFRVVGGVAIPSRPAPDDPARDPADRLLSAESRAVLLSSDSSFSVIDRSEPEQPVVSATVPATADEEWGACLEGDLLTLMRRTELDPPSFDYTVELVQYDLSAPEAPELVQVVELEDTPPHSLSCDGDRVVATSWRELRTFHRQGDQLAETSAHAVPAIWSRVEGDRALVQLRESGARGTLQVVDLAALDQGTAWADAAGPAATHEPNPYALLGGDGGELWSIDEWTTTGRTLEVFDWAGDTVVRAAGPALDWDGVGSTRARIHGDIAVIGDITPRLFDVSCPDAPVEVTPDDITPWIGLDSSLEVEDGVVASRSPGSVELVSMRDPLAPTVLAQASAPTPRTAAGTRFAGIDAQGVVLGETRGGTLSTTDLGCVPAEGDPELGPHEACAPVLGVALAGERLAVLSFQDAALVHVYALEGSSASWEGTIRQEEGAWCQLVSDGAHVALVDVDRVWPLDLEARTVGEALELPDGYLPVRAHAGVLYAAGDQLHRWDLATGAPLPTRDLPAPPLDFDVRGDRVVGAAGAVTLTTLDLSCE
jgi:hypothetical protein